MAQIESDPLDSWDLEEEPATTPEDDVSILVYIVKLIFN